MGPKAGKGSTSQGLKPSTLRGLLAARLKPCPDASQLTRTEPNLTSFFLRLRLEDRRVAPVSEFYPNHNEGGPGPSLLGTGERMNLDQRVLVLFNLGF